eukprot:213768_1
MSTDDGIINQIDICLSRYYAKNGNKVYFNKNNIGKFREFCDENGFDDDFVEEEIRENFEDCQLLDFDDHFPFIENQLQDQNKNKEIYRILQKCFSNANAYKDNLLLSKPLNITPNNWNVNNTEIEETKRIYLKTLKTIFNTEMQSDINILKVITIGRLQNVPYLQYLTDMYLRDRIAYKNLNITKWSLKNKYMLNLLNDNKFGKIIFEIAKASIDSFFHRICPILMFQPQIKIQDSLLRVSNYILLMVKFIYNLALENNQSCPFQADQCIIFNKVESNQQMNTKGIFSFEDDSDDSDSNFEDEIKDDLTFYDCIGDIKIKLKSQKLLYYESIDNVVQSRFSHEFNKFKNTIISKKYKGLEFMEYPRNKRFVTIIDRRTIGNNDDENDEKKEHKQSHNNGLLFFEPPNECNTLPKGSIPEWYFDSSRTCIIPKHIKNENVNINSSSDNYNETITSSNSCKGALLILSFHVLSSDEIKCYMYLNGTVTRFFPSDIINVLPLYFDPEMYKNKEFVKSQKQVNEIIEEMKSKLRDYRFESFYEQYKIK